MPKPSRGTRTYVSPKREEQARGTRTSILEAAQRLFVRDGYGMTSIRAVAEEAGVAVQTVYAVFGSKRQLVTELAERAVTGDEGPQSETGGAGGSAEAALQAEPDAHRRAQLDAAFAREITERLLPLFSIMSDAAAVDPEFAQLNRAMIARRRAEIAAFVHVLAGADGLRVSHDEAAASLFVLYSPQVAQILVEHVGWSFDRYEKWLADAIERLVLGSAP